MSVSSKLLVLHCPLILTLDLNLLKLSRSYVPLLVQLTNFFCFPFVQYLKELGDIKSQLAATHATAEASALSAESAQSQCRVLSKQLHERTSSLKEHEYQVTRLGEQLDNLQKELQTRESSQKQLRDEVMKVEGDIMRAVSVVRTNEKFEMQKVLDEDSPKNFERINKLLTAKDDEIARLRDELKIISAHWRFKTKELEDQVSTHALGSLISVSSFWFYVVKPVFYWSRWRIKGELIRSLRRRC